MSGPRSDNLERERKLAGWAGFELPDLGEVIDGVIAVVLPEQHLEATYYDAADLRLARSGITVRFRTGDTGRARQKGKWTVKLPDGESGPTLVRREIDIEAPGRVVPEAVASLVRAHIRSTPMVAVGVLSTRRRRMHLKSENGTSLVEVADDEVSVLEGRRVALRFRELEVEVLDHDGGADLLERVVDVLTAAGAASADQTPKIVRALGPRALAPPEVVVPVLDDSATLSDVVRAATAAGFARLLQHDPGVRLGGDIEDVHQARVAARRLRSDLRTFRKLLDPERASPLRDELQWLGAELGHVRDADVLLERLQHQATLLPAVDARAVAGLLRRLEAQRKTAGATLLAALDSDRYRRLLDLLVEAIERPPVNDDAFAQARGALPDIVRGPWKHLRDAVDALVEHPEDEALHDIRIRAKRARYAAEAAAPVMGKPAQRFAKAVAGVQSVLGDLQDAVVAEDWLRNAGSKGPAAQALVAGQLIAVQRDAMETSRRSWAEAWHEVAGKKLRSWLS